MNHILFSLAVNKHKPWIETTYHGIVTENDDKVLLDPPLIALDKDAPLRYAGERGLHSVCILKLPFSVYFQEELFNLTQFIVSKTKMGLTHLVDTVPSKGILNHLLTHYLKIL